MNDDEVSARNVRTVEAFYEAERVRDISAWADLWHEEGRQTLWFANRPEPTVGRSALVTLTKQKFDVRPEYGMELMVEPLADPSLVLARLRLLLQNPALPVLDLWCMFHFDADGLITEVEEIGDTAGGPAFPE